MSSASTPRGARVLRHERVDALGREQGSQSGRAGHARYRDAGRGVAAGRRSRLAVSALTLMEFRASVSDDLRRALDPQKTQMDVAWALRARGAQLCASWRSAGSKLSPQP